MKQILTTLLIIIVLGATLLSSTFEVPETECVIVLRFGNPIRILEEPGLAWKLPTPIETIVRIDTRLRILDPPEVEFLTIDKKNVTVDVFAAWSVKDPLQFLVTVINPTSAEAQLGDLMRAEVGAALGSHELSDLLSTEAGQVQVDQIMQTITDRMASLARETYGIDVLAIRLKRLNFPEENRQAVFRRMEAERERIARQYRSEGEEQAEIVRAQADLEHTEIVARAELEAGEIRSAADAEATTIYASAYSRDAQFYEFLKTLETYEQIIGPEATVVVPTDSPLMRLLREPK